MKDSEYRVMISFAANLGALKDTEARLKELSLTSEESLGMVRKAMTQATRDIDLAKDLEMSKSLMEETGLSAENLAGALKKLGMRVKGGGKLFNAVGEEIEVTTENIDKLRKASIRFKPELLSIMFGAMALQRYTGNMLRSLITTFQRAHEDTEGLGKATWHLQAAWEFFKYSLVDALTQSPLFKMLVDWATELVNALGEMSDADKRFIALGIAIIFVIASLVVMLAQLGLAKDGLEIFGISMNDLKGTSFLGLLEKIAFWALVIYIAFYALDEILGVVNDTFGTNVSAMGILLGLFRVGKLLIDIFAKSFTIGAMWILASISWMLSSLLYFLHWIQIGDRIVEWALKSMANGIYTAFKKPLDWLFDKINRAIDWLNKRAGFEMFARIEYGDKGELWDLESFDEVVKGETMFSKLYGGLNDLKDNLIDRATELSFELNDMLFDENLLKEIWQGAQAPTIPETSGGKGGDIINNLIVNNDIEVVGDISDQIGDLTDEISTKSLERLDEIFKKNKLDLE